MRDLLLQSTDCLVVAHGPRNSACAILVPQPEVERTSPARQSELFTTWPLGKSLIALFFFFHWKSALLHAIGQRRVYQEVFLKMSCPQEIIISLGRTD